MPPPARQLRAASLTGPHRPMARPTDCLTHLPAALRFLTRLPVPPIPGEPEPGPPDLDRLGPAFPLAGALIGLIGLIVHLTALTVLPVWIAALITVAVLVAITGGLHEDGLADTADALGGMSRERRLAIMRDSRLGSFGALALMLALALRVGALAELSMISVACAGGALVAASALSRLAALGLIGALPSARPDGLAGRAGRPGARSMWIAGMAGAGVAAISIVPTSSWHVLAGGAMVAALAFSSIARLAAAKFGGQTGDVAGAAALTVEIAFLIGALIFARQIG